MAKNNAHSETLFVRKGEHSVRTVYKAGNRTVIVNSIFGTDDLGELLFSIIKTKLVLDDNTADGVYLEGSQPDSL